MSTVQIDPSKTAALPAALPPRDPDGPVKITADPTTGTITIHAGFGTWMNAARTGSLVDAIVVRFDAVAECRSVKARPVITVTADAVELHRTPVRQYTAASTPSQYTYSSRVRERVMKSGKINLTCRDVNIGTWPRQDALLRKPIAEKVMRRWVHKQITPDDHRKIRNQIERLYADYVAELTAR
jgi:hypothetical protein